MKNSIVLCSGGLDSVVTAYCVKNKLKYDNLAILFFDYGQRTLAIERKLSKKCAKDLRADFVEIKLDWLGKISDSLINNNEKVRRIKIKDLKGNKGKEESNNFYVPNRNAIFLSYAMALAESLFIKDKGVKDIFVGFVNEGVGSYPDTTIEFVDKMNELMKTGRLKGKIIAPLIKKNKEDVVSLGKKLGINFKDTFSCYADNKKHCGVCLACRLRQEAFYWANVKDPTSYKERMRDFRVI